MGTLRDALKPIRRWIVTVQGEPMEGKESGSTPMFQDPDSAGRAADECRTGLRRKGHPVTVKVEPLFIICQAARRSA